MEWNSFYKNQRLQRRNAYILSYQRNFSVSQVCFNFNSEQQIQSLIDALNLETAKSELLNKTEKDKNLDSLFNNHKPLALARGFVVYSPQ